MIRHPQLGEPVAVYEYRRASGDVAFAVCRFHPKDFRPAQQRGGRWVWNLEGAPHLPYRLPELEHALAAGETIWIVDGEKDADALAAAGAVATCCARSQGWTLELAELLTGARRIVIVADRDGGTGQRQALEVRDIIVKAGAAASSDIDLVQAAEGKDAADHLAAGGTLEEFVPVEIEQVTDPLALKVRRLADVEMRSIDWLDKPLFQRAAFHLLCGRKGQGKGTFVASLAARVTRGELHGRPMNVLVCATEDSDEIDLKPRIVAAAGDPERVYTLADSLLLPRDLEKLRETAIAIGDLGLLVLDPIASHVRGDTHAEDPVRFAIDPLNQLAYDLDCVLVGVRHLSEKDASKGALAAVLGASAWVQVPRAVLVVAADDEQDMLFHIGVAAGNRSARGAGRVFRIELADVGLKEHVTRAVEIGESPKSVDELLGHEPEKRRAAVKRDGAADIILRELAIEPKQLADLKAICAAEVGASGDTVWKAANGLKASGVVACTNSGPGTPWLWYMRKSDGIEADFGTSPSTQLDTEVTDLRTEVTRLPDFLTSNGKPPLPDAPPLDDAYLDDVFADLLENENAA